jgi:hypothetical protein
MFYFYSCDALIPFKGKSGENVLNLILLSINRSLSLCSSQVEILNRIISVLISFVKCKNIRKSMILLESFELASSTLLENCNQLPANVHS